MNTWKQVKERPQDDKTYLVCWWKADENCYSSPHRAYFLEQYGHFFSLENNNSHPIMADIYYEYPDPNDINE